MKTQIRIYKNKDSITIQQESTLCGIITDAFTTLTILFLQYVSYTYLGNGILIQIFIALAKILRNELQRIFGEAPRKQTAILLDGARHFGVHSPFQS